MANGKPCPHLEELLPGSANYTSSLGVVLYYADVEKFSEQYYEYNKSLTKQDLEEFLKRIGKYGLKPYQLELLVDRFVYNMTFQEMTEERGYTSLSGLYRLFKATLDELKERGIKLTKAA